MKQGALEDREQRETGSDSGVFRIVLAANTHQGQAGGPPRWLQDQQGQKQVMTWARLMVWEVGDLVNR